MEILRALELRVPDVERVDRVILRVLDGLWRPRRQWQAVELGADIIKADPTDDANQYHEVIQTATGIPVLVRGGGRVADDELLRRIVVNLISNALKFTTQGSIRLVVQGRAGGWVRFEVHDTGPGIAREHLARLTERFYRVDGSRNRETGGTGLGLSIVKHILIRHQAKLDISSEFGKGSTFSVIFPKSRAVQKT